MKKMKLTPPLIMALSLYSVIVLFIAGIGYGMYVAQSKMSEYATIVDHQKIDVDINEEAQTKVTQLNNVLAANKDNIERAASVVSDTHSYQYQDQIVHDINAYAAGAGVTVLSYTFSSSTAATSGSAVAGLKTVSATMTFANPIDYVSYQRFLQSIERNLTKMQVTQATMSADLKNPGAITVPAMTVEVYVR